MTRFSIRVLCVVAALAGSAFAAHMKDVTALITQASRAVKKGDTEKARSLLKEARVLAQTVNQEANASPAEALLAVVQAQAKAGFYDDAQITVESFPDSYSRTIAIATIGHIQAENKKIADATASFERALKMVPTIAIPWSRSMALRQIADFQSQAGMCEAARTTANSIADPELKTIALRHNASCKP